MGVREKDDEIEELQARLAKLEAKNAKQANAIAELTKERDDLENQKLNMLKTLHRLKEQIQTLQKVAEKRGLGKQIQDLMAESGLQDAIDNPEWNIFNRLYEDALRRQAKVRQLMQEKGVYQARADVSLKTQFSNVGLSAGGSLALGSTSQVTLSTTHGLSTAAAEGHSSIAHFVSPRLQVSPRIAAPSPHAHLNRHPQLNRHPHSHFNAATDDGLDQLRLQAGLTGVQHRSMKPSTSLPVFAKIGMGQTMPSLDASSRQLGKSVHAHQPPPGWLQIESHKQASAWNSANADAFQGAGFHSSSTEPMRATHNQGSPSAALRDASPLPSSPLLPSRGQGQMPVKRHLIGEGTLPDIVSHRDGDKRFRVTNRGMAAHSHNVARHADHASGSIHTDGVASSLPSCAGHAIVTASRK